MNCNCTAGILEYRKKMGAAAWLYEAKLHGDVEVEVVVKFVRFQYGRDPHECVAGKQLAPTRVTHSMVGGVLLSRRM